MTTIPRTNGFRLNSLDRRLDLAKSAVLRNAPGLPFLGFAAANMMQEMQKKIPKAQRWNMISIKDAATNPDKLYELMVYSIIKLKQNPFFVPMDLSALPEVIAMVNGKKLQPIYTKEVTDQRTGKTKIVETAPYLATWDILFSDQELESMYMNSEHRKDPRECLPFDLETIRNLKHPDPWKDGRLKVFLLALQGIDAQEDLDKSDKDPWSKFVYTTGPFTLATQLFGDQNSLLASRAEDYQERFEALMRYCEDVVAAYTIELLESGADAITILDPNVSMLSWVKDESGRSGHEKYLIDPINRLTALIHQYEVPVLYHACKTLPHLLEPLKKLNVQGYSLDPNVDLRLAYDFLIPGTNKIIIGNVDTQNTLEIGPPEKIRENVFALLNAMKGCKRFFLGTSCDVSAITPYKHFLAIRNAFIEWHIINNIPLPFAA